MKKTLQLLATTAVISSFLAVPTMASSSNSNSYSFYCTEYATSSGGYILTPFNLYVSVNDAYTSVYSNTIQVSNMSTYVDWRFGSSFPYTGYVAAGPVDIYNGNGTKAGSYSLNLSPSYIKPTGDITTYKAWSGSFVAEYTGHERHWASWTGTGGSYPGWHNVHLDAY